MSRALLPLRKLFDGLYALTSDETADHGIYADTRSEDGVYSAMSTQSGESTYGVGATGTGTADGGTEPGQEAASDEREDHQPGPTCDPTSADD